jgi:hypothetical protein
MHSYFILQSFKNSGSGLSLILEKKKKNPELEVRTKSKSCPTLDYRPFGNRED